MLINCLCVGAGGFVGAVLRYLLSLIPHSGSFPIITLLINVVGSFALAYVATAVLAGSAMDEHLSLLLRVGVCGGFTTFSTFAFEAVDLAQKGSGGAALAYVVLSVVLSLVACYFGMQLAAQR